MSRFRPAVASLFAIALLIAGCGGSIDDRPQAAEPPSAASSIAISTPPVDVTTPALPIERVVDENDPLRVLVIGDSVTYEIAPPLVEALESGRESTVQEMTQWGFALSFADANRWPSLWGDVVKTTKPDVVLLQLGIWDIGANIRDEERNPHPTDGDWDEKFAALLDFAIGVLNQEGAEVYLVGMLPGLETAAVERLNAMTGSTAERHDRVYWIDAGEHLRGADGEYVESVDGLVGIPVPLRKPDGVHLCREGARRAAEVIVDRLHTDWGISIEPSWISGEWRSNPRYNNGPCDDPWVP